MLNGSWLVAFTGGQNAAIGLLDLASGNFTGTLWQAGGGATASGPISGTYTVTDLNPGRVTGSGNHPLVTYVGDRLGFVVGTDDDAAAGEIVFQSATAPALTDAALSYQTAFANHHVAAKGLTTSVGTIAFDGKGAFTGQVDISAPGGLSATDFAGNYAINADGSGMLGEFPLVTNGIRTFFIDARQGVVRPLASTLVK
jgi:hypothetical protein